MFIYDANNPFKHLTAIKNVKNKHNPLLFKEYLLMDKVRHNWENYEYNSICKVCWSINVTKVNEGIYVKKDEANDIMDNINSNIQKCHILKQVLSDKMTYGNIDYNWYHDNGYGNEEIKIGEELVDLYIILKNYIQNNS